LNIRNINYYINFPRKKTEDGEAEGTPTQPTKKASNDENAVHMFQEDISGASAIDNAF